MRWMAVAALLALGCGGSGGSGEDGPPITSPLQGNWILYTGQCAEALDFQGTAYVLALLCPSANAATIDAETEKGSFATSDGNIYFTAEQTTCPATAVKAYYVAYGLTGGGLALTYTDGISVFQRNTASGGSAILTFGCFSAGVFTPGPLVAL